MLLDALEALQAHRNAVIVVGAQAVYLRTSDSDLAVAPFTTDGDLALDPSLLADEPALEDAMRARGFRLRQPSAAHVEPGVWTTDVVVDGERVSIPVDLIVPEGFAAPAGRRAARLPGHGRHATRKVAGLEAALVDHSSVTIAALAEHDTRSFAVEVAGVAALFIAKAHKISDRLAGERAGRVREKDAADVYRLMRTTSAGEVGVRMGSLRNHPVAGAPTDAALQHLADLFGRRRAEGVELAVTALRLAVPEAEVRALCTAYIERLRAAVKERS